MLALVLVVLILTGVSQHWNSRCAAFLAIAWIVYSMVRLHRAYKYYLLFDHPVATLSAVALIVMMIFAILFPSDVVNTKALVQYGVRLY